MRRLAVPFVLAVGFVLALPGPATLATPTPPYLIVNHMTQECAERWIGDDCRWCDPLPGWEVVGLASNSQCPEGYSHLDYVEMACRGYETPFCCSGGAHRGDCEDMVVHDEDRLCGFVDELEGCILPVGWQGRPAEVMPQEWSCPHDSRWQPELLSCLDEQPREVPVPTGTSTPDAVPPHLPVETGEPPEAVAPTATPEPPATGLAPGTKVLLGLLAIGLGIAILGLLALLRRRT
jgi:hypothetical protein